MMLAEPEELGVSVEEVRRVRRNVLGSFTSADSSDWPGESP